jgi:hypothetical protein
MPDLNEFIEWVNQGERRVVNIRLSGKEEPSIIAGEWKSGDYFCQIVNKVDEIDLEQEQKQRYQEQYERLKVIFEPEETQHVQV